MVLVVGFCLVKRSLEGDVALSTRLVLRGFVAVPWDCSGSMIPVLNLPSRKVVTFYKAGYN